MNVRLLLLLPILVFGFFVPTAAAGTGHAHLGASNNNPYLAFGRWLGYGFGDGYHACPCPEVCVVGCGVLSRRNDSHPALRQVIQPVPASAYSDCDSCANRGVRALSFSATRVAPTAPRLAVRPDLFEREPAGTRQAKTEGARGLFGSRAK